MPLSPFNPQAKSQPLTLATRASQLALYQAHLVKSLLEQRHPGLEITLLPIKTSGDLIQDRPLREVGGKALFVKEIEEALLQRKADFAVHSMKDVPAHLPQGLKLGVVMEREDASDLFISRDGKNVAELPSGSRVGSSSLRRKIQLLRLRPDLEVIEMRGNIDTRLRKLQEGQCEAILLATAGIKRLGLLKDSYEKLNFIASPGQGALGLEYREGDADVERLLQVLDHHPTHQMVAAERRVMQEFEASCQLPLGAQASLIHEQMVLKAFVSDKEGLRYLEAEKVGHLDKAQDVAEKLIQEMKVLGADEIFK